MTDYHDFTSIDTAEEQRQKLGVGNIWINAAKCEECGDIIRSENKHHSPSCSCGNLTVDGGSWYAKRNFKDGSKWTDKCVYFNDIKKED